MIHAVAHAIVLHATAIRKHDYMLSPGVTITSYHKINLRSSPILLHPTEILPDTVLCSNSKRDTKERVKQVGKLDGLPWITTAATSSTTALQRNTTARRKHATKEEMWPA